MMSFSEWLQHFKTKSQKEIEELEDKKGPQKHVAAGKTGRCQ